MFKCVNTAREFEGFAHRPGAPGFLYTILYTSSPTRTRRGAARGTGRRGGAATWCRRGATRRAPRSPSYSRYPPGPTNRPTDDPTRPAPTR